MKNIEFNESTGRNLAGLLNCRCIYRCDEYRDGKLVCSFPCSNYLCCFYCKDKFCDKYNPPKDIETLIMLAKLG